MIIGTWNIKTMNNKEEELVEEMEKRKIMTWLGNIEQYGREKGKTLSELDRMAKERKKWKDFTEVTRR